MTFPEDDIGLFLQEMHDEGIDLTQPMWLDCFILFEQKPQAEKMAEALKAQFGQSQVTVFADEVPNVWDVQIRLQMVADYDALQAWEQQLERIADKFDGYLDGFGAEPFTE